MRIIAKIIVFGLFAAFVFSTIGRLFAGAPIPPYPPPIIGVDRVPVHSKAWLIYTHTKQYRNDRVFAGGFQ